MKLSVDVNASLAWRLAHHGLESRGAASVPQAVAQVVTVRAWPPHKAEAAIAARRPQRSAGAVDDAISDGSLIASYAFRGGAYLFTPETGDFILAARALARSWESPRYQRQAGFVLDDWEPFRVAMRDILAAGPRTRDQISSALKKSAALSALAPAALGVGSDALYKPLHWWGDISFGPRLHEQATFQLRSGGPCGLEPLDLEDIDSEAIGARVLRDYVRSYAPVTLKNLRYWLTEGLSVPSRLVSGWLRSRAEELVEVETAGTMAYVLREDLDGMQAFHASDVVRLVPGFDPWILGPGIADPRIIDPRRRPEASKGSDLVLVGGRVVGTWRLRRGEVQVSVFEEEAAVDEASLVDEVRRTIGADQPVSIIIDMK